MVETLRVVVVAVVSGGILSGVVVVAVAVAVAVAGTVVLALICPALSCCQARVEQRRQRVFPVPVGDSKSAFSD